MPRRVEVRFETDSLKVGKSDSRTVRQSESLKVGQSDSGDRRTNGQTDRRMGEPRRWGRLSESRKVGKSDSWKVGQPGGEDRRTDRQFEEPTSDDHQAHCPTVRLSNFPTPTAVEYNGTLRSIEAVLEIWRVDDEWWRDQIARRYIEVVLEGGKHVVLFEDLLKGTWFVQEP